MQLLQKILNKFNGLQYRQEYLCLAAESFLHSPRVYITDNNRVKADCTGQHLFVGYHPLVLAFSSSRSNIPADQQTITISLSQEQFQPNDWLTQKDATAQISLKKIHQVLLGGDQILFFEGITGWHRFVPAFNQFVIRLNNRLYNKKKGNVFLEGDLYTQVQAAYAIPRKISLVTVGENGLYNLFPTDLHGQVNDHYIISLRHEGLVCKQVSSARRIVISDVPATSYRKVYALGKNHMQPLKEKSNFEFDPAFSKSFHLPLPKEILSYKELELENSFMHGIHKILLFKIVYKEQVSGDPVTLAHIHNCYATWRYKKRISSNLLLR